MREPLLRGEARLLPHELVRLVGAHEEGAGRAAQAPEQQEHGQLGHVVGPPLQPRLRLRREQPGLVPQPEEDGPPRGAVQGIPVAREVEVCRHALHTAWAEGGQGSWAPESEVPESRRPQAFPLVPFTTLSLRHPDGKRGEIERIWVSENSGIKEAWEGGNRRHFGGGRRRLDGNRRRVDSDRRRR